MAHRRQRAWGTIGELELGPVSAKAKQKTRAATAGSGLGRDAVHGSELEPAGRRDPILPGTRSPATFSTLTLPEGGWSRVWSSGGCDTSCREQPCPRAWCVGRRMLESSNLRGKTLPAPHCVNRSRRKDQGWGWSSRVQGTWGGAGPSLRGQRSGLRANDQALAVGSGGWKAWEEVTVQESSDGPLKPSREPLEPLGPLTGANSLHASQ